MAVTRPDTGRRSPATFYAPPERLSGEPLSDQIRTVSESPIVSSLLTVMGGYIAILNEHRQVLAVNETFLSLLGIDDPAASLGLRPGEMVGCVHAADMPGGCGTSPFCQSCGAVIAIMASLSHDRTERNVCALQIRRCDRIDDLYFEVQCTPVRLGSRRFLLLFLRDMTVEQQKCCLDSSFFHDIRNILFAVKGAASLIATASEPHASCTIDLLARLTSRLETEIALHRKLIESCDAQWRPTISPVTSHQLLGEQHAIFDTNELCRGKSLSIRLFPPDTTIMTDPSLASRVITNMVTNALEATPEGGTVELYQENDHGLVTFAVWNQAYIPEPVQLRIFQRNFSTKGTIGRGFGTFSMKFFGEKILGGKVSFTSSPSTGTLFRFSLPLIRGCEHTHDATTQ